MTTATKTNSNHPTMQSIFEELKTNSSFTVKFGDSDEEVPLYNTTSPNIAKSEFESAIENFNLAQDTFPKLDSSDIHKSKKCKNITINWNFKEKLKESFAVEFLVDTFLGCEFVDFDRDGLYLCIITKYKLFFKKIRTIKRELKENFKPVKVFSDVHKHSNIEFMNAKSSLKAVFESYNKSHYIIDSFIGKPFKNFKKTDVNEDIFKGINDEDEFVLLERTPNYPIRQYVAFDNCICFLRDIKRDTDELESALLLLTDPFDYQQSVNLDTDSYEFVFPSWISGFMDTFGGHNSVTFFDTNSKLVETYKLILKEDLKYSSNGQMQWYLEPLTNEGLNAIQYSRDKRERVLQSHLNDSEIANLISTNSKAFLLNEQSYLMYYYLIRVDNRETLKICIYKTNRENTISLDSISKHSYPLKINHIKFELDLLGFESLFEDGTMGYSVFFLVNSKITLKDISNFKKKSLKKVKECHLTHTLLRVFKECSSEYKTRYMWTAELFILYLVDRCGILEPLDAFFLLLSLKDCKKDDSIEFRHLHEIILPSLEAASNNDEFFINVIDSLFWYHEELCLDTTSTFLRQKLGVMLFNYYSENISHPNRDWKMRYLKNLYNLDGETIGICNKNKNNPLNGSMPDSFVAPQDDKSPCKSILNISFLISLLLSKTRNSENSSIQLSEFYSENELATILDFFDEVKSTKFLFTSVFYKRIFKLMDMFMDVAKKILNPSVDGDTESGITLTLDDDYPLSLIQFFESYSITHEKLFYEIKASDELTSQKFFLRNDVEKTIKAMHSTSSNDDSTANLKIQSIDDSNMISTARILAFMHPILNNNLFNNKIAYSEREKVKTIEFLRHISKPLGWASLAYNSDSKYVFSTSKNLEIDDINLEIVCAFDEYKTIPCNEKDAEKILSLQFVHMSQFATGIAKGLSIAKNIYGVDDKTISNMRPEKLNAEYGGFLYGLGLNGYLKAWNSSSIYYTVVTKFSPLNRGFFLGLGCSNISSENELMTKIMVLHLESALPHKNLDLHHHYTLQISALLSLGLLHLGTFNHSIDCLALPLIFRKITFNEQKTQKISFNVSASIAVGLNSLYNISFISDDNYNKGLDDAACSILTLADKNGQLYYLGVVIYMLLLYLRSEKKHAVKMLEIYIKENGSTVIDLESCFYLELFKNMVQWDMSMDKLIVAFADIQNDIKIDSITLENVMIYYELAADILSYSIMNVGMCNDQLKNIALKMIDNLVTLSLSITSSLKTYDMSYTMKICIKHLFIIRRILLESLSLNFCSSGDVEITQRCNFFLSNEDDFVSDFHSENYPTGFDMGEPMFNVDTRYDMINEADLDNFKDSNRRPLFYDSDRSYLKYEDILKDILHQTDEQETNTVNSPTVPSYPFDFINPDLSLRSSNDDSIDNQSDPESTDPEEGMFPDSDEEVYFEDNSFYDDNVADKDSIKNKRGFIEKISYFSDIYSDSISASFSLGLLNLSAKQKIVDISGNQKKLAFLILSMLPIVNSFPFELQDIKYFYFMTISDNNRVYVLDGDNDKVLDDKKIELRVEYKDGQEFIKEAPFCIPRLYDVLKVSVVDDKTYYPLSILGEALVKNHDKNKDIKIFVKKRTNLKNNDFFNDIRENENIDTITTQDEMNFEFKKRLNEDIDIQNNPEINLFVLSNVNTDFGIDLWNAKNFRP